MVVHVVQWLIEIAGTEPFGIEFPHADRLPEKLFKKEQIDTYLSIDQQPWYGTKRLMLFLVNHPRRI